MIIHFIYRGLSFQYIVGLLICNRASLYTCNNKLDQIINVRIAAIIDFIMRNIWKTVSDSQTNTVKQYVRLQRGICPEKFQPDHF